MIENLYICNELNVNCPPPTSLTCLNTWSQDGGPVLEKFRTFWI